MTAAAVVLAASVFAVNALLTAFRWFPGYDLHLLAAPAPETLAAFLVIALAWQRAARGTGWMAVGLGAVAALYALFGLGEAFYRHIYRRAFVPQTDLSLAPAFFEMITGWEGFERLLVQIAGAALIFAVTAGVFAFLFARIGRAVVRIGTTGTLAAAAVLGLLFALFGPGEPLTLRIAAALGPTDAAVAGAPVGTPAGPPVGAPAAATGGGAPPNAGAAPEDAPGADAPPRYALPGLRDEDVHLFMIESYGRSVFENEIHWARLADTYAETARMLAASGYAMRSHYLEAVTFGGTSWLSDATLLTGVRIDSQKKYDDILATDRSTMIDLFNDAGYESVLSAPGMSDAAPAWTSFYAFDRFIFHEDFDYQGRYFTFGVMPDQYQLDVVRRRVLGRSGDTPQFIKYILVSSHTPWNFFPPYLPDWDRIGDGTVYDSTANTYYENSWIMGNEYFEGYAHAVRYVLEVVRGYLIDHVEGDDLIIITGDHQPKFPVSSEDATFAVPVHVLSRDDAVVAAFEQYGYEPGLVPSQAPPHPPMEGFFDQLSRVVGGPRPDRNSLDSPGNLP
jgi:hypothetical protein